MKPLLRRIHLQRTLLVCIAAWLMLAQTPGAFSTQLLRSHHIRTLRKSGTLTTATTSSSLLAPPSTSFMTNNIISTRRTMCGIDGDFGSRRHMTSSPLLLAATCDPSSSPTTATSAGAAASPSSTAAKAHIVPPLPVPAGAIPVPAASPQQQQQSQYHQQQQQKTSSDIHHDIQPAIKPQARLPVVVALTRERGCNQDLLDRLSRRVTCVEVPCIEFGVGPDLVRFRQADLASFDAAVLTSPRAAQAFVSVLNREKGCNIKIAVVGSGTRKVLSNAGIHVDFEPSDMTAAQLVKELPESIGSRILYPASAIAPKDVEQGLSDRGFHITRLDVYSTLPAVWTDADRVRATRAAVVGLASPSAARVWAARVGLDCVAACIGPSTLAEAQRLGFRSCVCPEASRGADGLADAIVDAATTIASTEKSKRV